MASPGKRILIIIENLPAPFDRRVWQEAVSLKKAGYEITIICPTGKGYEKKFEVIDDIYIYRHPLPIEAGRTIGYLYEYSFALFWEFVLSIKVFFGRGFDAIHACNPPDLLFLVALPYKLLFGKKFVFDHHDINPELYLAKKGRGGVFYKLLILLEKLTFKVADISIATNESYKEIALRRGGKKEEDVFVVRSAPVVQNIECLIPEKPNISLKRGKKFMVGYVGVMAKQDGVDYLLKSISYIIHDEKRTDILFVLIGNGPEWEELVKYAQKLQLQDYVLFTGRIPDREMIEYISICDVCVNSDVVNEFNDKSTMNKVLEYMVLGKPIVQFDMKEARYSAQDASLYAKSNDTKDFAKKILTLLDNEAQRKKMGEIGKERIKKELSWENSERSLIEAYTHLFTKR